MAALVKNNVQTGTITFISTDTSKTATITSVDTAKCFILIDWQHDGVGSGMRENAFLAVLTNATTITISKGLAANTSIVRWWAVEFSAGITVSHFTGTATNTNQAIGSTVDLAKTFGIVSWKTTSAQSFQDITAYGVDIVSTTNFQVKVAAGTENIDWAVQIVEFDSDADPVVEAVTISIASAATSGNGTISAVTIADSMVIGSGNIASTGFDRAAHLLFDWTLTSTTNLQIARRTATTVALTGFMFVIDWGANVDIRNGTDTLTTAEGLSETQTFTALGGTGDAIAFIGGGCTQFGRQAEGTGGGRQVKGSRFAEVSLDSTTQITIARGNSAAGFDYGPYTWQVVDFSGFVAAGVTTRRYSLPLTGAG